MDSCLVCGAPVVDPYLDVCGEDCLTTYLRRLDARALEAKMEEMSNE